MVPIMLQENQCHLTILVMPHGQFHYSVCRVHPLYQLRCALPVSFLNIYAPLTVHPNHPALELKCQCAEIITLYFTCPCKLNSSCGEGDVRVCEVSSLVTRSEQNVRQYYMNYITFLDTYSFGCILYKLTLFTMGVSLCLRQLLLFLSSQTVKDCPFSDCPRDQTMKYLPDQCCPICETGMCTLVCQKCYS